MKLLHQTNSKTAQTLIPKISEQIPLHPQIIMTNHNNIINQWWVCVAQNEKVALAVPRLGVSENRQLPAKGLPFTIIRPHHSCQVMITIIQHIHMCTSAIIITMMEDNALWPAINVCLYLIRGWISMGLRILISYSAYSNLHFSTY